MAKKRDKRPYTVCGMFSSGETFCHHVMAVSSEQLAIADALIPFLDENDTTIESVDLDFIFEGHHNDLSVGW